VLRRDIVGFDLNPIYIGTCDFHKRHRTPSGRLCLDP
jgi:hypothetical protein